MGRPYRFLRLSLGVIGAVLAALFLRAFFTVVGMPAGRWFVLTLGCGVAFAFLLRSDLASLSRRNAVLLGVPLLGVLAFLGAPYTSRDYFLLDFNRVRIGMTKPEVEQIMQGYLTGTGIPKLPGVNFIDDGSHRYETDGSAPQLSPRGCQTYRHSTDAAWNADWGTICYKQGIVVSTSFSPD